MGQYRLQDMMRFGDIAQRGAAWSEVVWRRPPRIVDVDADADDEPIFRRCRTSGRLNKDTADFAAFDQYIVRPLDGTGQLRSFIMQRAADRYGSCER